MPEQIVSVAADIVCLAENPLNQAKGSKFRHNENERNRNADDDSTGCCCVENALDNVQNACDDAQSCSSDDKNRCFREILDKKLEEKSDTDQTGETQSEKKDSSIGTEQTAGAAAEQQEHIFAGTLTSTSDSGAAAVKPGQSEINNSKNSAGKALNADSLEKGSSAKGETSLTKAGSDFENAKLQLAKPDETPVEIKSETKLQTAVEKIAGDDAEKQVALDPKTLQNKLKLESKITGTDEHESIESSNQNKLQISVFSELNGAGANSITQTVSDAQSSQISQASAVNQVSSNLTGGQLPSASNQVIQNISENVKSVEQRIEIALNPPELGRVRLSFELHDGQITGLIEAEKVQTRYELERNLAGVVEALQQNGIQIRRIDVTQNSFSESNQQKNNFTDDFHSAGQEDLAGRTWQQNQDTSSDTIESDTLTRTEVSAELDSNLSYINDGGINVYL